MYFNFEFRILKKEPQNIERKVESLIFDEAHLIDP